jgi:hypothetical protein
MIKILMTEIREFVTRDVIDANIDLHLCFLVALRTQAGD